MNPNDPAYNWSVYDRTVFFAQQYGIKVVFSIVGTPPWANGAKGVNVVPKSALDLERFATAAARRYSGSFRTKEGRILPPVRQWLAWNEPNNPAFLRPQYKKVKGKPVIQSAIDYAKICNAVVKGVRKTTIGASKVACGVTGPRGNNNPNSSRPATSPLPFLRAMHKAGAKGFDAYAHHPYYGAPRETPSTPPPPGIHGNAATAITLGNINLLIREVTRLYGNKRIWITEYGYQTNPPDKIFGVSFAEPGALPDAGLRDRQAASADRHVPLVPAPRRAPRRRRGLAVGPADRLGGEEALVRRVPAPSLGSRPVNRRLAARYRQHHAISVTTESSSSCRSGCPSSSRPSGGRESACSTWGAAPAR